MMMVVMMVWMVAIGSGDILEQGRAAVTILVRHWLLHM